MRKVSIIDKIVAIIFILNGLSLIGYSIYSRVSVDSLLSHSTRLSAEVIEVSDCFQSYSYDKDRQDYDVSVFEDFTVSYEMDNETYTYEFKSEHVGSYRQYGVPEVNPKISSLFYGVNVNDKVDIYIPYDENKTPQLASSVEKKGDNGTLAIVTFMGCIALIVGLYLFGFIPAIINKIKEGIVGKA